MAHEFLSPGWIEAAQAVRSKYSCLAEQLTVSVRMNAVVTDTPFSGEPLEVRVDTTSGTLVMDLGALDEPDLTIITDYATARAIFVAQDQAAAMQAFMSGRIRVQGDMMKLMTLQTQAPSDEIAREIADEINAFTV